MTQKKTLKDLKPSPDESYTEKGNAACQQKGVLPIMASYHKVTGSLHDDKGTWVVRARVYDPLTGKKKQRSKSTGLRSNGNKRLAQRAMREIVAQWEKEANAGVISEDPLFSEYVEKWLAWKKDVKENTLKSYRDYADTHILPVLGDLKMRQVSMVQLNAFYEQLLKTVSSASARKIHVVVCGAMWLAKRDGVITDNHAKDIKFPKSKKFEGTAYAPEQVAQLLKTAAKAKEPLRAAVVLGVCYGLRRSEIVGLRWKDIDFEKGMLTVRNTVTQNGKLRLEGESTKTSKSNRTLALLATTVPYLKRLQEQQIRNGLVLDKVCAWPSGNKPVRPDYLTRQVPALMEREGLPRIRLHDLRHTAATLLATKASPKQVQEFLGHEDIATTMNIYTHLLDSEKRATSNLMNTILETAAVCSEKCSEEPA